MQLPDRFHSLQSLADQWAVSDDDERYKPLREASQENLEELVAEVWPELPSIHAYLESNDDEQAHLLGDLAQAACEAKLILEDRKT